MVDAWAPTGLRGKLEVRPAATHHQARGRFPYPAAQLSPGRQAALPDNKMITNTIQIISLYSEHANTETIKN